MKKVLILEESDLPKEDRIGLCMSDFKVSTKDFKEADVVIYPDNKVPTEYLCLKNRYGNTGWYTSLDLILR